MVHLFYDIVREEKVHRETQREVLKGENSILCTSPVYVWQYTRRAVYKYGRAAHACAEACARGTRRRTRSAYVRRTFDTVSHVQAPSTSGT